MSDKEIDVDVIGKGMSEDENKADNEAWSYYFMPKQASKLISKRCLPMSVLVGVYYLFQLVGCIGVVNFYSDIDRFSKCNAKSD